MNNIRSDFPKDVKDFFYKLQNYLDTELYFYGSVNRTDYIHNKSDIDVAVFTDNENSIISKLQHFLEATRDSFDKIVWRLDKRIIYGYKIKCSRFMDLNCEIAIYNNDFKTQLLNEMNRSNVIPLWISILLSILKTFYYTIPLLPSKTYAEYKRFLFNKVLVKDKDTVFFLLKQNKE
jgi:hypothetical protein